MGGVVSQELYHDNENCSTQLLRFYELVRGHAIPDWE